MSDLVCQQIDESSLTFTYCSSCTADRFDASCVGVSTPFTVLVMPTRCKREPIDALAPEKKALILCWFYQEGTFFVSETVMEEVAKIGSDPRREFHQGFVRTLFHSYPVRDQQTVGLRTKQPLSFHTKHNDCRILAEAEDLNLDFLLSFDERFQRRLGSNSPTVRIETPSSYWNSLKLPKGTPPKTVPHHTNPLSRETWWKW